MEIEMTSSQQPIQEEKIKDQFLKGPQQPVQYTQEELKAKREHREKELDELLPFMRKEEEYGKLQASLMELDVLMGRISTKQVPGLLGLELAVRETQANGYLLEWVRGQEEAVKQQKQQQAMAEQEKQAKEWWDSLTPEAQEQYVEETNKIMAEKGLSDAYNGLTEGQRINIIMQSVNAKSASASVENNNATTE